VTMNEAQRSREHPVAVLELEVLRRSVRRPLAAVSRALSLDLMAEHGVLELEL
jgi:hypothetical protein